MTSFLLSLALLPTLGQGPVRPNPEPDPDPYKAAWSASNAAARKGDWAAARDALLSTAPLLAEAPESDPRQYETYRRLSAIHSALGDFEAAESALQTAIYHREKQPGFTSVDKAPDMMQLAMICRARKDLDRGLTILGQVNNLFYNDFRQKNRQMDIRASFDDPRRAEVESRIGIFLMEKKMVEGAVNAFSTAIRLREIAVGPDHSSLLNDLDRLGAAFIVLRRYPEAVQVFRRTLAIREGMYGRESAELIQTIEGLAYACFGNKQLEDAEKLYLRLLALWESSAGKDNPMVASTLDKLSYLYREMKRVEDARSAAARANNIRALFLAEGLRAEAGQRIIEKDNGEAARLYDWGLAVLDFAPDSVPELKDIKSGFETQRKLLDATQLPPSARPARKSTPAPKSPAPIRKQ